MAVQLGPRCPLVKVALGAHEVVSDVAVAKRGAHAQLFKAEGRMVPLCSKKVQCMGLESRYANNALRIQVALPFTTSLTSSLNFCKSQLNPAGRSKDLPVLML